MAEPARAAQIPQEERMTPHWARSDPFYSVATKPDFTEGAHLRVAADLLQRGRDADTGIINLDDPVTRVGARQALANADNLEEMLRVSPKGLVQNRASPAQLADTWRGIAESLKAEDAVKGPGQPLDPNVFRPWALDPTTEGNRRLGLSNGRGFATEWSPAVLNRVVPARVAQAPQEPSLQALRATLRTGQVESVQKYLVGNQQKNHRWLLGQLDLPSAKTVRAVFEEHRASLATGRPKLDLVGQNRARIAFANYYMGPLQYLKQPSSVVRTGLTAQNRFASQLQVMKALGSFMNEPRTQTSAIALRTGVHALRSLGPIRYIGKSPKIQLAFRAAQLAARAVQAMTREQGIER